MTNRDYLRGLSNGKLAEFMETHAGKIHGFNRRMKGVSLDICV